MGASRFSGMLTRARVSAGRPPAAHRPKRGQSYARRGWGPPAQPPRAWRPPLSDRARAAGLMLCGSVVAGAVVACMLGVTIWLLAAGIHHVASG